MTANHRESLGQEFSGGIWHSFIMRNFILGFLQEPYSSGLLLGLGMSAKPCFLFPLELNTAVRKVSVHSKGLRREQEIVLATWKGLDPSLFSSPSSPSPGKLSRVERQEAPNSLENCSRQVHLPQETRQGWVSLPPVPHLGSELLTPAC